MQVFLNGNLYPQSTNRVELELARRGLVRILALRNGVWAGFATAISLFVLYLSVVPIHLTWANSGEDGGDLLAAMMLGGIPHPTGYPTYILLGALAQVLPFGSPYLKGVLVSIIPTALAGGLLAMWVNSRIFEGGWRGSAAGIISGLVWGTGPLVWGQAVIVEVYGLNSFFIVMGLWWVTVLLQDKGTPFLLLLILALLFGVGLGNHITLVLLLPLIVLGFIHSWKEGSSSKHIGLQILAMALGLLVYLYLPIRARGYPAVNWGNPQTLDGFIWEVTGKPYQGLLVEGFGSDVSSWIGSWAQSLIHQFGLPLLMIGLVGVIVLFRRQKWASLILFYLFLVYSLFSIGYRAEDSGVYIIPALIYPSVGIGCLAFVIPRYPDFHWHRLDIAIACAIFLIILIRIPSIRSSIDPRKDTRAEAFMAAVMPGLPQGAIVLTQYDRDSFALGFMHSVMGARSDTVLIVEPLTQFTWYQETLVHTEPGLDYPLQVQGGNFDWIDQTLLRNSSRPVCRTVEDDQDLMTGLEVKCNR